MFILVIYFIFLKNEIGKEEKFSYVKDVIN